MNREWFTTLERVATHPATCELQNVVRTSVPKLRTVHLTVIEDPLVDDASHALIPELNSFDYKNDKAKRAWIKETARRLSLELSEMAFLCPASRGTLGA